MGSKDNKNNHKIPVIVPKTLVPDRYQNEKKYKIQQREKQRMSKWKLLKKAAEENKQIVCKNNQETKPEINGHNKINDNNDSNENEINNDITNTKENDNKEQEKVSKNEKNQNNENNENNKNNENKEGIQKNIDK